MIKSKSTLIAATAFVTILPALVTWWLPGHFFNASVRDYVPTALYHNDASLYWQEINAFARAGFHTGYSGREEDLARLSFIHFGWQNFIVYFYGIFAVILGWQLWSSVIWNPIMLGIALFFFMVITKCSLKQVLFTGLLTITFWPLLFFLPTMMAESFHYTIAVLAATGFAFILNFKSKRKRTAAWLTTALLFIGTVARPSWAPLLFLSTFLAVERETWKSYFVGFLTGLTICTAAYGIFYSMMPDTSTYSASGMMISGRFHPFIIFSNFLDNLKHLTFGGIFLVLFRIQVIIVLSISVYALIFGLVKNCTNLKEWIKSGTDWTIHSFNLISIVLLTMLLYTTGNWGDYRVVSIYLFFSGILAIARWSSITIPVFLIVSNILITPVFADAYQKFKGLEFAYDKSNISRFEAEIRPYLQYKPTDDPWENTVLYGGAYISFPTELIALPAGMGMRFIYTLENLRLPIRSRYVIFDKDFFSWYPFKEQLGYITSTHIGDLYYCSPESDGISLHVNKPPHILDMQAESITIYQRRIYEIHVATSIINTMAVSHYSRGDYPKALALLKFITFISPDYSDVYYNIACIYAKQREVDDSIIWLKLAVQKGFNNWNLLQRDHDLDSIRNTKYYRELLNNI